jgi:hypothetical protein
MLVNHPVDIAVDASGNLIVGNTGSAANNYAGSVIRVNPQTGVQTLVSSFSADTGLDSVEVGQDGTIFASPTGLLPVGSLGQSCEPERGRRHSAIPRAGHRRRNQAGEGFLAGYARRPGASGAAAVHLGYGLQF